MYTRCLLTQGWYRLDWVHSQKLVCCMLTREEHLLTVVLCSSVSLSCLRGDSVMQATVVHGAPVGSDLLSSALHNLQLTPACLLVAANHNYLKDSVGFFSFSWTWLPPATCITRTQHWAQESTYQLTTSWSTSWYAILGVKSHALQMLFSQQIHMCTYASKTKTKQVSLALGV